LLQNPACPLRAGFFCVSAHENVFFASPPTSADLRIPTSLMLSVVCTLAFDVLSPNANFTWRAQD